MTGEGRSQINDNMPMRDLSIHWPDLFPSCFSQKKTPLRSSSPRSKLGREKVVEKSKSIKNLRCIDFLSLSSLSQAEWEKKKIESIAIHLAKDSCVIFYFLVKNTNLLFCSLLANEAHIIRLQKRVLKTGSLADWWSRCGKWLLPLTPGLMHWRAL